MVMRAIAKKEFAEYIKDFSQQEKDLFADFFYEGVLEFRKLGRRAAFTNISVVLKNKILDHIDDIVSDQNRLAKVLGFLHEYICNRVSPLQVTHEECELIRLIFTKLKQVSNISLRFHVSVFTAIYQLLNERKPKGLIHPKNLSMKEDAQKILVILTT